jgi:soluble P-type ATPase
MRIWHILTELINELEERQIRIVIAGRKSQIRGYAHNAGIPEEEIEGRLFSTVELAVCSYLERNPDIDSQDLALRSGPIDLT